MGSFCTTPPGMFRGEQHPGQPGPEGLAVVCMPTEGCPPPSSEQGIFLVGKECFLEARHAAHRGFPQHHPLRPDRHAQVVQQDREPRGARALLPLPRARLHHPERGLDPERAVQPESVSSCAAVAVSSAHGPRALGEGQPCSWRVAAPSLPFRANETRAFSPIALAWSLAFSPHGFFWYFCCIILGQICLRPFNFLPQFTWYLI